jgi:hypothetical protein
MYIEGREFWVAFSHSSLSTLDLFSRSMVGV